MRRDPRVWRGLQRHRGEAHFPRARDFVSTGSLAVDLSGRDAPLSGGLAASSARVGRLERDASRSEPRSDPGTHLQSDSSLRADPPPQVVVSPLRSDPSSGVGTGPIFFTRGRTQRLEFPAFVRRTGMDQLMRRGRACPPPFSWSSRPHAPRWRSLGIFWTSAADRTRATRRPTLGKPSGKAPSRPTREARWNARWRAYGMTTYTVACEPGGKAWAPIEFSSWRASQEAAAASGPGTPTSSLESSQANSRRSWPPTSESPLRRSPDATFARSTSWT